MRVKASSREMISRKSHLRKGTRLKLIN